MSDKSFLRAQYDREGYAIYNDVIDRELIAEASDHVDWLLEQNPDLRPEQLHNNLMTDDPFWVRLISDDRLLDIAEEFIGPKYSFICVSLYFQATNRWPTGLMASRWVLLAIGSHGSCYSVACRG